MQIPPIIFGTFQYGSLDELYPMIRSAYENGIVGFDTSPSYNTEEILGSALSKLCSSVGIQRDRLLIQDKVDGWQMEESKGRIANYVKHSIAKLQSEYIDVLFIHWPFPEYLAETWQAFAELKKAGWIKKIGLSNVRCRHVEKLLKETGVMPDVIQIERHPLRICKEDVEYFKKKGFIVEAYSPVCRMDERLVESELLNKIAHKYDKTIGQVILRWHVDTGVVPVFMTKKESRVAENMNIFDFSLSIEEVEKISSMDINYKIFVESVCCPGI